jgi:transposase-like protein
MDMTAPRFTNDTAAREHLEALRWPNGPVCAHCGGADRQSKLDGKAHRPGVYFCGHCRQQYTVTVGTVFERSKVALHKWVLATHLLCASKKGMSAHQLHRTLGVTYKTAWFMAHRIREAMTTLITGPLGGSGKVVEADETTESGVARRKLKGACGQRATGGAAHKQMNKIVSLVERGGKVRSFHVADVTGVNLKAVLTKQVHAASHLMTDASIRYNIVKREQPFAAYDQVTHQAKEYVRGMAHTNTVEGFFSILKRGLIGTYHHVGSPHLHRYANEFDFRYNHRQALGFDDNARTNALLKEIAGKRLTYRRINAQA